MKLIMVHPRHYDIRYAINPFMKNPDGSLPEVDKSRAIQQWEKLKTTFEKLNIQIEVIEAREDLPDMVFAANHALRIQDGYLMANMKSKERKEEIPVFRKFYESKGYNIHADTVLNGEPFEGMGDAIWSNGNKALFCGYGQRTSEKAVHYIIDYFSNVKIHPLRLIDERFYHLDTCLTVRDERAVAWVPSAFSRSAQETLIGNFERLIPIQSNEAEDFMAANAFCPDRKNVVLQRGAETFCQELKKKGFTPIEVETGEFLKAGGSVFCLKLEL